MSDTVTLIASRPALVGGRRIEAGARVDLAPAAALSAVESGRLRFADDGDRERCHEARRRETAAALKAQAAPPFAGPPDDPRWRY